MEPREPNIIVHGPVAEHDQRCAVLSGRSAVMDLSVGVYRPSWEAQGMGWHLVKAESWLQRLAIRMLFQEDL